MIEKNNRHPLFDGHCDTGSKALRKNCGLYSNGLHVDLERLGNYGPSCQIFAIFAENDFELSYKRIMAGIKSELEKNSDSVALCRNAEDIEKTVSSGKTAALISVEGAELLGCDEDKLAKAKDDGVSSVNITWNFENALSGTNAQGRDKGLSSLGKSFVKKCGALHIAVDVSHISDKGFWDVAECEVPFFASHSNSRSVCGHKRNLTDDMFKAIVSSGGVAGLNMYADFLGDNPDISTVIKHIDRFLSLGGEKNIAIGADFDGCESLPKGIKGVQDMYKIYDELIRLGYGKELADDIFFNNMFRFFKKAL